MGVVDKMTTKAGNSPIATLPSRSALSGIPVRSCSRSGVRQTRPSTTRAIAAPEKWDLISREEEDRLQRTDAFAELVALSKKQTVNRPQKVGGILNIFMRMLAT